MASSKGMILLEPRHKIIEEFFLKYFSEDAKYQPLDQRLADFDGTLFRIGVDEDPFTVVTLSISMRALSQLREFGGELVLQDEYEPYLAETVEGFDLTIAVDVTNPPEDQDVVIAKFSGLKQRLLSAPFQQAFLALEGGQSDGLPPIEIDYRPEESIYIVPRKDRIIVIFSVVFEDPNDQAMARVFLQEFEESQRHVSGAPPVNFSKTPPRELKGTDVTTSADLVGFLSFAVLGRHISSPAKKEKLMLLLPSFRSYLMYHIKASKCYLHTRMRNKVSDWLKVLNRAHPPEDTATS